MPAGFLSEMTVSRAGENAAECLRCDAAAGVGGGQGTGILPNRSPDRWQIQRVNLVAGGHSVGCEHGLHLEVLNGNQVQGAGKTAVAAGLWAVTETICPDKRRARFCTKCCPGGLRAWNHPRTGTFRCRRVPCLKNAAFPRGRDHGRDDVRLNAWWASRTAAQGTGNGPRRSSRKANEHIGQWAPKDALENPAHVNVRRVHRRACPQEQE